jgi:hypothetical protein
MELYWNHPLQDAIIKAYIPGQITQWWFTELIWLNLQTKQFAISSYDDNLSTQVLLLLDSYMLKLITLW